MDKISEIFTGLLGGRKKMEAPTPVPDLSELKQHEKNLTDMMSQGADFRSPADANSLREVRNKIAAIENQTKSITTPESGITQMPVTATQVGQKAA